MRLIFSIHLLILGHLSYTQEILELNVSPCDKDINLDYLSNRLITNEKDLDTTILILELKENCNYNPNGKLEYINDTLILVLKNTAILFDLCECFFRIEIKALGIDDTNYVLAYNYQIPKISKEENSYCFEQEILEIRKTKYIFPTLDEINNPSQWNQFDANNEKIGTWQTYSDDSLIKKTVKCYDHDSLGKSFVKWSVSYNQLGNITEVCSVKKSDGMKYFICLTEDEYLKLIDN